MANIKTRLLILSVILLVFAAIAYQLRYDNKKISSDDSGITERIPYRIGKWEGKDLYLEEQVYKILETRSIIHREYSMANGKSVLLSIVHYNDTKVDFHAPESCLGGLGQNVDKKVKTLMYSTMSSLQLRKVSELISHDNNSRLLSYYFFKTGKFLEHNYIGVRMKIAYNKIFNDNTSASLIRITTNIGTSDNEAGKLLEMFLKETMPVIIDSI